MVVALARITGPALAGSEDAVAIETGQKKAIGGKGVQPQGKGSAEDKRRAGRRSSVAEAAADHDRDIALLCNPRAGGRWKELAAILDLEEAQNVRRIVTDSIDDVGPALASLSRRTQLLCIYGGDGTIQRILDKLYSGAPELQPQLAFIGGGTMNVAARWCGLSDTPRANFRSVVRAYRSGRLLLKEVPLLEVHQGSTVHYGFTWGAGPIVRILDTYERGRKGKIAGAEMAIRAALASLSRFPADMRRLLEPMEADISFDGKKVPYSRFSAVFCNSTGQLHIGVAPFIKTRSRDTFYCAAYAVGARETALLLPFIARGWLPLDPKSLLKPISTWKQIAMSYLGRSMLPTDPRYVNDVASRFEVHCAEELYTVDGEIFASNRAATQIRIGPMVRLAVSATANLGTTMRLAAEINPLKDR